MHEVDSASQSRDRGVKAAVGFQGWTRAQMLHTMQQIYDISFFIFTFILNLWLFGSKSKAKLVAAFPARQSKALKIAASCLAAIVETLISATSRSTISPILILTHVYTDQDNEE